MYLAHPCTCTCTYIHRHRRGGARSEAWLAGTGLELEPSRSFPTGTRCTTAWPASRMPVPRERHPFSSWEAGRGPSAPPATHPSPDSHGCGSGGVKVTLRRAKGGLPIVAPRPTLVTEVHGLGALWRGRVPTRGTSITGLPHYPSVGIHPIHHATLDWGCRRRVCEVRGYKGPRSAL